MRALFILITTAVVTACGQAGLWGEGNFGGFGSAASMTQGSILVAPKYVSFNATAGSNGSIVGPGSGGYGSGALVEVPGPGSNLVQVQLVSIGVNPLVTQPDHVKAEIVEIIVPEELVTAGLIVHHNCQKWIVLEIPCLVSFDYRPLTARAVSVASRVKFLLVDGRSIQTGSPNQNVFDYDVDVVIEAEEIVK